MTDHDLIGHYYYGVMMLTTRGQSVANIGYNLILTTSTAVPRVIYTRPTSGKSVVKLLLEAAHSYCMQVSDGAAPSVAAILRVSVYPKNCLLPI